MTTFPNRDFQNGDSEATRVVAKSRNPLAELAAEIAAMPEGSELMTKAEADALVKAIKFDNLSVEFSRQR
jgi:hypothetical protein